MLILDYRYSATRSVSGNPMKVHETKNEMLSCQISEFINLSAFNFRLQSVPGCDTMISVNRNTVLSDLIAAHMKRYLSPSMTGLLHSSGSQNAYYNC